MLNLTANDYPTLKEMVTTLQNWDRKAVINSKGAAIFLLVYDYVSKNWLGLQQDN